jgi:hypothetical protein
MALEFREADWKVFRQLREIALQRFCQRVLDDVEAIACDARKSCHERYLAIYRLMQDRDRELAVAFNNPRRSTAWIQFGAIHRHRLLTDEELGRLRPELREALDRFLET